jgi:hypothetical protein
MIFQSILIQVGQSMNLMKPQESQTGIMTKHKRQSHIKIKV